jgi:hypothetical protein
MTCGDEATVRTNHRRSVADRASDNRHAVCQAFDDFEWVAGCCTWCVAHGVNGCVRMGNDGLGVGGSYLTKPDTACAKPVVGDALMHGGHIWPAPGYHERECGVG